MAKIEFMFNFASENKLNQYPAMKQHEFKIRFYGRTELAQEDFPNMHPIAAWAKLKLWRSINPDLCYLIKQKQRSFTSAQVEEIVKILGEP